MHRLGGILAVFVLALPLIATSAPARADQASVVSGCTVGSDCAALVTEFITEMQDAGLTQTEIDDALADLVDALGAAAPDATAEVKTEIVAGIRTATGAMSDTERAQQLAQIADTIEAGATTQTSAIDGDSGSPQ